MLFALLQKVERSQKPAMGLQVSSQQLEGTVSHGRIVWRVVGMWSVAVAAVAQCAKTLSWRWLCDAISRERDQKAAVTLGVITVSIDRGT